MHKLKITLGFPQALPIKLARVIASRPRRGRLDLPCLPLRLRNRIGPPCAKIRKKFLRFFAFVLPRARHFGFGLGLESGQTGRREDH
jgi:hypothetical protein